MMYQPFWIQETMWDNVPTILNLRYYGKTMWRVCNHFNGLVLLSKYLWATLGYGERVTCTVLPYIYIIPPSINYLKWIAVRRYKHTYIISKNLRPHPRSRSSMLGNLNPTWCYYAHCTFLYDSYTYHETICLQQWGIST